MRFDGDRIMIGGISAAEIAARYGTPTYVYDEQKIRANYRRAYNAFAKHYPDFQFFYAVKCCNNPAIVNVLRQEGAGADCASVNEILLAKSVGLTGEQVMFSGNFLSDDDIRQGLESGVIFNLGRYFHSAPSVEVRHAGNDFFPCQSRLRQKQCG